MTTILLDDKWHCAFAAVESGVPAFTDAYPVDSLADWRNTPQHDNQLLTWLKRSFQLDVTDYCVNYWLYLDLAPVGTRIYVNGQQVATYSSHRPDDSPYELDITLNVALGDNELVFRVDWDAVGQFAEVRLQPVPCE